MKKSNFVSYLKHLYKVLETGYEIVEQPKVDQVVGEGNRAFRRKMNKKYPSIDPRTIPANFY